MKSALLSDIEMFVNYLSLTFFFWLLCITKLFVTFYDILLRSLVLNCWWGFLQCWKRLISSEFRNYSFFNFFFFFATASRHRLITLCKISISKAMLWAVFSTVAANDYSQVLIVNLSSVSLFSRVSVSKFVSLLFTCKWFNCVQKLWKLLLYNLYFTRVSTKTPQISVLTAMASVLFCPHIKKINC